MRGVEPNRPVGVLRSMRGVEPNRPVGVLRSIRGVEPNRPVGVLRSIPRVEPNRSSVLSNFLFNNTLKLFVTIPVILFVKIFPDNPSSAVNPGSISNLIPIKPPGYAISRLFFSEFIVKTLHFNGLYLNSSFIIIPGIKYNSSSTFISPEIILPPITPPFKFSISVPGLLILNDLIIGILKLSLDLCGFGKFAKIIHNISRFIL